MSTLSKSVVASIAAIPAAMLMSVINPQPVQSGGRCVAYSDGRQVGSYSCDVERDSRGRVTFIQWRDGLASVKLGGWERVNANCFGASENLAWRICAQ